MNRQNGLLYAAPVVVLICAAVLWWAHQLTSQPKTVVIGAPLPLGAEASSGPAPLGPHVDEQTGVLTIAVGDAVDSNGVQIGVTNVTAPFTASGSNLATRGQFMLVDVQVHNSGDVNSPPFGVSSDTSFQLQDQNGEVYPETTVPGAPNAPAGNLSPGATVSGTLGYDVPPGRTYRLLFLNPQVSQGQIAIDLGAR